MTLHKVHTVCMEYIRCLYFLCSCNEFYILSYFGVQIGQAIKTIEAVAGHAILSSTSKYKPLSIWSGWGHLVRHVVYKQLFLNKHWILWMWKFASVMGFSTLLVYLVQIVGWFNQNPDEVRLWFDSQDLSMIP